MDIIGQYFQKLLGPCDQTPPPTHTHTHSRAKCAFVLWGGGIRIKVYLGGGIEQMDQLIFSDPWIQFTRVYSVVTEFIAETISSRVGKFFDIAVISDQKQIEHCYK